MKTAIDLRRRSFLTIADFSPAELTYLLDLSAELKAAKRERRDAHDDDGQIVHFRRPSSRRGRAA